MFLDISPSIRKQVPYSEEMAVIQSYETKTGKSVDEVVVVWGFDTIERC